MPESKIKSFADACIAEGIDPGVSPDVSQLPEAYRDRVVKGYELDVIIAALNNEDGKWSADYSDSSQAKYEPRFFFSPGSGWSCHGYAIWHAGTDVGARRVFKSYDVMRYAVTQFLDHYKAIL